MSNELDKTFRLRDSDYPYSECIDEDGYSYTVSFAYDNREGLLFICECGAHIEWLDPYEFRFLPTTGEELFGPQKSLGEEHLKFLMLMLSKTKCNAELLTTENITQIHEDAVAHMEAKKSSRLDAGS